MIWNLFPFKGDFTFEKSQRSQGAKSGLWVGWVTWVIWCFSKLRTRCDAWTDVLLWRSCQSPVAHSCSLLNHPNSFCKGMLKLNTKVDADFLLYLLSLNVTATQYTCSLNDIYLPHWLVQWSHHCSRMHIPVHSPWPPGYTDVMQSVLVILTMVGLFLDRTHIYRNYFCLFPTSLSIASWKAF